MGTTSPVKISIVKAWTNVNARALETTLHNILDNSRLDGECFWDGNESPVEAVTNFIASYHPEAANKSTSNRIYGEVVPLIEKLNIKHTVTKNE